MKVPAFAKKALTTASLAAAVFIASPARAQQTALYTHTFAVPSDAACVVDVVSTAADSKIFNTLSFTGYLPAGDRVAGRFTTDLSGGKATSVYVPLEFEGQPSTVVASTTAPSKASLTCVKPTADIRIPIWTPWYNVVLDIPLLGGTTQQSLEFPTQRLTFLKDSPGTVFQGKDEQVAWKNNIVSTYLGQDNTAQLVATTTQLDPTESNTSDHTIAKYVSRGATNTTTFDDFLPSVGANSGNGAITLSDTGLNRVYATQVFDNGYTRIAVQFQAEFADKRLYFPQVIVPPAGNDNVANWQEALSLTNTADQDATVYLRPFNEKGAALDFVVVNVPARQTLTQKTQDLFASVRNRETIQNVETQSTENIFGLGLFKYNQHIIPIRAATGLDLGTTLYALRAQAGQNRSSSYAVKNPGNRAETVQAVGHTAAGKTIGAADTFTLAPHQSRIASIADQLNQSLDALADVAYVTFTAMTAPDKVVDFQNPTGKITATLINTAYETVNTPGTITFPALHIEGSVADNADAQRVMLRSDQYNPRLNIDEPKYDGGPHPITATIINDQPVTSMTYNPLQDGNLKQNYSATWNNKIPDRMLAGTSTTVDGPTMSTFIPLALQTHWVTLYTPLVTITNANNITSKFNTNLNILFQESLTPEYVYGPFATANSIHNDLDGCANVFYKNRLAIADSWYATRPLSLFKTFCINSSDPASQYRIRVSTIFEGTNTFGYLEVSDPDPASSYWPIPFAMTPAGEKAIDDLKNFFKVGEQWVDSPGTYQQK